jgi:hypothetical protein
MAFNVFPLESFQSILPLAVRPWTTPAAVEMTAGVREIPG